MYKQIITVCDWDGQWFRDNCIGRDHENKCSLSISNFKGHCVDGSDASTSVASPRPDIKFKPDFIGQTDFDSTRYIHILFDTIVDTKDSATGDASTSDWKNAVVSP